MFTIIKFSLSFAISFFILSIPINDRLVFDFLSEWAEPVTQNVFSVTKKASKKVIEESKDFGKKLFSNADPIVDQVNSGQSAALRSTRERERANKKTRKLHRYTPSKKIQDEYSKEEIEQLKSLMSD